MVGKEKGGGRVRKMGWSKISDVGAFYLLVSVPLSAQSGASCYEVMCVASSVADQTYLFSMERATMDRYCKGCTLPVRVSEALLSPIHPFPARRTRTHMIPDLRNGSGHT